MVPIQQITVLGTPVSGRALVSHPVFRRLAQITNTPYRVFFTNQEELNKWLKVRGWIPIEQDHWDEDSEAEWQNPGSKKHLKLTHKIFDRSGLKMITEDNWKDRWLELNDLPQETDDRAGVEISDDDIPF